MKESAAEDMAPGPIQEFVRGCETISLAVVSPMANEAATAVPLVEAVLGKCAGLKSVVFYAILDRATRDNTRELLSAYALQEPRLRVVWAPENRCLVDAYVRGYREALASGHDFILEMDAGFSHRPEDIPKFLAAIPGGYDCVFGSRFIANGKNSASLLRRFLSRGGSILTNGLLGTRLSDMTSGYELFSRDTMRMILGQGLHSRAHFFQTEIKFHCRKLKLKEVPITYTTEVPKVPAAAVRDALQNLVRLCRLRWTGK